MRALLLANLRSHFAEFLGNSSLAHLRILSLPTCVGFGTGRNKIIARSFSWKLASTYSVLTLAFPTHHIFDLHSGFACRTSPMLAPTIPAVGPSSLLRHSITLTAGTGISTSCPSTTLFSLILGPDLPRADEPSPGNLEFQTDGILTHLIVTYTGILTSILSSSPLDLPSSCIERSPTTIL